MGLMAATAILAVALIAYVVFGAAPRRATGWLATGLAVLAWAAWGALLVERGLGAGRWPVASLFEAGLWLVWMVLSGHLILERVWRERRAAPFVLGIALVLALGVLATPLGRQRVRPLAPALRSSWLRVHVLCALLGYSSCAVAAGLGFSRLARERKWGATEDAKGLPWLPPADETDYVLERVISLGFPWLCLGVLTGALRAQSVWGRYWGWDPKETWALITLLWYLAILHLRPYSRWRGRRMAWLAIAGFCLVLATFAGVGLLTDGGMLETLHSY